MGLITPNSDPKVLDNPMLTPAYWGASSNILGLNDMFHVIGRFDIDIRSYVHDLHSH